MVNYKSALFIFFSFIIFFFISCSRENNNKQVLVYNCPADANQIKALQEEVKEFEKENNITIKLIPFSGEEKLLAMIAANQEPDIFYTNNIYRDKLAAENRIINLKTVAEKDPFLKNIRPETIENGKSIDGGWYHLCNWTYTFGIYYNKSLFAQNNIPFPKPDWSWEEMIEAASRLTKDLNGDGNIDQFGIYIAPHFISAFERMNHANYKLNNLFVDIPEESIESYKMYSDLRDKYKVMPKIEKIESMGMQYQQLLETGKLAMIVEAVPNLDLIQTLKIDWDIAPLPKMNGKDPLYFRAYGGGLSISTRCKYPDKAWEFIKWLVFKSSIFSPNPMLADSNFVTNYIKQHPILKDKNFKQVWSLSEKYNGGDFRDFVRYSSWTAITILERMAPALENVLKGKESIDNYRNRKEEVNKAVINNLKEYLMNPQIKPEFRTIIESQVSEISRK